MRVPIFPISVRAPVAVTTNEPRPSVTAVPMCTMLRDRRSLRLEIGDRLVRTCRTGSDSPVSADSSTSAPTLDHAAVGRHPIARRRAAPHRHGTSSLGGDSSRFAPSRSTRATAMVCMRSPASALLAFHSVANPMTALRRITTTTATPSMTSPTAKATPLATTSRTIIKLRN
jgi:hypothetical protein